MAITKGVKCDGCGKEKQHVNRWWLLSIDSGALHLESWGEDWEAAEKHLCGQECVIKAVSEFLSK